MPTTLNSRCSTCKKEFKNPKGLALHKKYIQKYNQRNQELDEIPLNTINEFKNILVTEIRKKLTLSFRSMGKKLVTIPYLESIYFSVFAGHIHYYSNVKRIYRCIFRGSDAYQVLREIFNSDNWGKKDFSQNQQTYVVCIDPIPWNYDFQNQIEEIDPLEKLLQTSITKYKIKRRPQFLRGEILIEWKKKTFKEINGNINKVGYLYINFYISQSINL